MYGRFAVAGPCLTRPNLSYTEPWHRQTHPLYAPKYGTGMQPKCVQIAEQHKTEEFPASEIEVLDSLSSKVVVGSEFVKSTSDFVSLRTNIISPFQEVYKTSPGGSSAMSNSL